MEKDFASYILNEKNYEQKMLIAQYSAEKLQKKLEEAEKNERIERTPKAQEAAKRAHDRTIFFDKSIVLRAQIAKMFLNSKDLGVNKNEVLTAVLLCNCKKVDNAQKLGKVETYAKEGAEYLSTLGFDKRFCRICEGLNRYSGQKKREKESDILELVDQFTGLILPRQERPPFNPTDALIVLKDRNLKNVDNRYLDDFVSFVNEMENVYIRDTIDVKVISKLVRLYENSRDTKSYIAILNNRYSEEIDRAMGIDPEKAILLEDDEKNKKNDKDIEISNNLNKESKRKENHISRTVKYTGRIINRGVRKENKPLFDIEAQNSVMSGTWKEIER